MLLLLGCWIRKAREGTVTRAEGEEGAMNWWEGRVKWPQERAWTETVAAEGDEDACAMFWEASSVCYGGCEMYHRLCIEQAVLEGIDDTAV